MSDLMFACPECAASADCRECAIGGTAASETDTDDDARVLTYTVAVSGPLARICAACGRDIAAAMRDFAAHLLDVIANEPEDA